MILDSITSALPQELGNDDCSVLSTITCDHSPKKKPILSHGKNPSYRKEVCFNESQNVAYESKALYQEDFQKMWYTPSEFKTFQKSRNDAARRIAFPSSKPSGVYGRVIERIYATSCHQSKYAESNIDNIDFNNDELEDLRMLYSVKSGYFIGLERSAVREVIRHRLMRRKNIVHIVLSVQRGDGMYGSLTDDKADMIRYLCEGWSAPSKIFALQVGIALSP